MKISQFQNLKHQQAQVIDGLEGQLKSPLSPYPLLTSRRQALLAGMVFIGMGLTGCQNQTSSKPNPPTDRSIKDKMPALISHNPPLSVEDFSFLTPDTQTVKLSEFQGQFVLLNLWATWCAPCVVELPSLNALSLSELGKQIKIIVLSVDDEASRPKVLDRIKPLKGLTAYHDPYFAAPKSLGPDGMPTTYLFNKEGKIIAQWSGEADWHSNQMVRLLTGLIKP